MIKLIRNLKQGQDVEMVKGCGVGADSCTYTDSSSCMYADQCDSDYSSCLYADFCDTDYNAGCTISADICGVDY